MASPALTLKSLSNRLDKMEELCGKVSQLEETVRGLLGDNVSAEFPEEGNVVAVP